MPWGQTIRFVESNVSSRCTLLWTIRFAFPVANFKNDLLWLRFKSELHVETRSIPHSSLGTQTSFRETVPSWCK